MSGGGGGAGSGGPGGPEGAGGAGAAGGDREPWTVLRLIRAGTEFLQAKGVERPRLDAEHLLADALGLDRLRLYLSWDRPLGPGELAAFRERLRRRGKREPLQYIRGTTSFRALELEVDPRALIPRPETEELVGALLDWAKEAAAARGGDRPLEALDLGTGTGAIALSLAVEGPFRRVVATDRSPEALELARSNMARVVLPAGVELEWVEGDLFAPFLPESGRMWDVVVSNPPYIAESERGSLEPEVGAWEPAVALYGGARGHELLDRIVEEAPRWLRPGGLLALEIGWDQGAHVAERIGRTGAFGPPRVLRDLGGRDRIVMAERLP